VIQSSEPEASRDSPNEEIAVPPWLEILLDVIGFAGFVVLAICHKAPRKDHEPTPR
jgi:hypothetical protein